MSVRNCQDIGDNLGRIIKKLMENQNLVKLLYFTDKNPISHEFTQEFLSQKGYETYYDFCIGEIYEKLIKIVPRVGPKETANSILAIQVVSGTKNSQNGEFKNLKIQVESFVPLTQWLIMSDTLRPFYILGEVQKTLNGKTINGLGKLNGGDFEINFLTEEISCYTQEFWLTSYD